MVYLKSNFSTVAALRKAVKNGADVRTETESENSRNAMIGGLDKNKNLSWVAKAEISNGRVTNVY